MPSLSEVFAAHNPKVGNVKSQMGALVGRAEGRKRGTSDIVGHLGVAFTWNGWSVDGSMGWERRQKAELWRAS